MSNLPTSPGPLQDVQKFIFEKELRKLFAFCGPIDAMGFETTNRLDAVHPDGDATCPPHESAHFTGTVWIDFKAAADAAYAKRMYDGYSMISGSPLGTRLHCALVDDSGKQPPLQHPMQQTLGNTTVPPLQEYLQAKKSPLPEYEVVETIGGDHEREYVIECRVKLLKEPTRAKASSRRSHQYTGYKASQRRALRGRLSTCQNA